MKRLSNYVADPRIAVQVASNPLVTFALLLERRVETHP